MGRRAEKEKREIRVGDPELKAIAAIHRALADLDTQAVGRVLTFCIDRARQDFERAGRELVRQAAAQNEALPSQGNLMSLTVPTPSVPEPVQTGA